MSRNFKIKDHNKGTFKVEIIDSWEEYSSAKLYLSGVNREIAKSICRYFNHKIMKFEKIIHNEIRVRYCYSEI